MQHEPNFFLTIIEVNGDTGLKKVETSPLKEGTGQKEISTMVQAERMDIKDNE